LARPRVPRIVLACQNMACGKLYELKPDEAVRSSFCSKACFDEARRLAVTMSCAHCGIEFLRRPRRRIRTGIFCSRACYHAWKIKAVVVSCLHCGTELLRTPIQIARNRSGFFCDKQHRNFHRTANAQFPRLANCVRCGRQFMQRQLSHIGCSKACGYAGRDQWAEKHPMWRGGPITLKCDGPGCDQTFTRHRGYDKGKDWGRFCSRRCKGRWHSANIVGKLAPNYVNGYTSRLASPQQKLCRIISNRIRTGINQSLRGGKNWRKWEKLVGYTVEQLKQQLKRTMPRDYTWADFLSGALHIDHRIPISAFHFDSTDDEDFRRCWSLCNLQLLPAKENMSKSGKLNVPFQPSLALGG
jgi:hypothetical protein